MILACFRFLCIEAYKTLNNLNQRFMKDLLKLRKTRQLARQAYKINLDIPRGNQVTHGTKSFETWNLDQKIRRAYLSTLGHLMLILIVTNAKNRKKLLYFVYSFLFPLFLLSQSYS